MLAWYDVTFAVKLRYSAKLNVLLLNSVQTRLHVFTARVCSIYACAQGSHSNVRINNLDFFRTRDAKKSGPFQYHFRHRTIYVDSKTRHRNAYVTKLFIYHPW